MLSYLDVCEYLINEGSSVTLGNAEQTTPLHYLVRKTPRPTGISEEPRLSLSLSDMLTGRRSTAYTKILDLMLEKGAQVDAQSIRGETPLHQASSRYNEDAVRWLINNNAGVYIKNTFGETPLDTLKGQETSVSELLEHAYVDDPTATIRELFTWGYGPYGQLGYPVSGGASDRIQSIPRKIASLNIENRLFTQIACGSYVTGAITDAGELFVWGRGNTPSHLTGSSSPAACPLLGNGKTEDSSTPIQLSFSQPIRKVALGIYHAAAITTKGELYTWGYGAAGQLGHGDKENAAVPKLVAALAGVRIVQVDCGETHTIALSSEGKAYSWGGCGYGQLGHGDTSEKLLPTKIASLDSLTVTQVACAATHSACLTSEGHVYVFGFLSSNQATAQSTPYRVSGLEDKIIRQVACGMYVTAALSVVGDVYTWGTGRQLGHPDSNAESTPRWVETLRDRSIRQISCGDAHIIALSDRGHLYSFGKDTFGQCGNAKGDQVVPVRIGGIGGPSPPKETAPLLRNIMVACGEKYSACITDAKRSVRDKYAWKILELQRSFVRTLYVIHDVYYLPLKSRHGANSSRSRPPPGATIPFVPDTDIAFIFGQLESLLKANLSILASLDAEMECWAGSVEGIASLFTPLLDNAAFVQYFENLPKALAVLETICDNSPQFIGYLQECKRHAETQRKAEPYEEESRDMDLGMLIVEPYHVCQKIINLLTSVLRSDEANPAPRSDNRAVVSAVIQLSKRIRVLRDRMMAKDQEIDKAPSVRSLNVALDGLNEYKSLCKQLSKSAKKIATLESSLANERSIFAACLSQLRTLDADDSTVASATEAFSDLNKRVSNLENVLASRLSSHFSEPLLQLIGDLDEILPSIAPAKKQVDEAHHDYTSTLTKLLHATKQKILTDPKKLKDTELEVQQKKKTLDVHAVEFGTRLKVAQRKKQRGQWALLAAMRAQRDQLASSNERAAALQQHTDALEVSLRTFDRREWGTHLATTVYAELAQLTSDHAAEGDSTILATGLAKLDEPVTLGPFPNFEPLVELFANPAMHVINALCITAGDEAEQALRSVVRILDAHHQVIPLVKQSITAEVKANDNPGTLFRQNTIATRIMTAYTKLTGTPYLIRVLKPFIIDIVNGNTQHYEVDPNKASGGENMEAVLNQNLSRLLETSQKILDAILRSANEFPVQLRILSHFLGQEVSKKFPNSKHASVGGFLFLRFICPALTSPGAYGLLDSTASDASRPLVLIGKLIQNVSNGVEFGAKESFMIGANPFITNNLDRVRNFFDTLTNLPPHILTSHPSIATVDETSSHDLPFVHEMLVKNLPKVVKSLAQYKQKEVIPRLWAILAELGDPSGFR